MEPAVGETRKRESVNAACVFIKMVWITRTTILSGVWQTSVMEVSLHVACYLIMLHILETNKWVKNVWRITEDVMLIKNILVNLRLLDYWACWTPVQFFSSKTHGAKTESNWSAREGRWEAAAFTVSHESLQPTDLDLCHTRSQLLSLLRLAPQQQWAN